MAKNEQKRLEFIDKIKEDQNMIPVCIVVEILSGTIQLLDEHSNTFKRIKSQVPEKDWTAFMHGLLNSFLSSLYVSAGKDDKECQERLKYMEDVNSDLLIGIGTLKGVDA